MKISELNVRQGNVEIEGTVKEIGEKRNFNKFGRQLIVTNAILEDDSGSIKLTLWNDDALRFKEGDRIKITNGYVSEFQGEKQLTSGKFGKIEKLEISQNLDSYESSEIEKLGEGETNSSDSEPSSSGSNSKKKSKKSDKKIQDSPDEDDESEEDINQDENLEEIEY